MKKTFRCHVNLEGFDKTSTGKRKVWRTDNELTYCCSFTPSLFIWEKNTKYNHYEGYYGYVGLDWVVIL